MPGPVEVDTSTLGGLVGSKRHHKPMYGLFIFSEIRVGFRHETEGFMAQTSDHPITPPAGAVGPCLLTLSVHFNPPEDVSDCGSHRARNIMGIVSYIVKLVGWLNQVKFTSMRQMIEATVYTESNLNAWISKSWNSKFPMFIIFLEKFFVFFRKNIVLSIFGK